MSEKLPYYSKESGELFTKYTAEQKDFLKDFCTQDKIQKEIDDWIKRLESKKEELFLQKLKELNIEFDLEEEKKRRFSRFRIETEMYKETYWYNDGSIEGLRIITFATSQPSFPNINDAVSTIKLNVDISYY